MDSRRPRVEQAGAPVLKRVPLRLSGNPKRICSAHGSGIRRLAATDRLESPHAPRRHVHSRQVNLMAELPRDFVAQQISESIKVKEAMLADTGLVSQIEQVAWLIVETYRRGGKVLIAGNGGSAADAQHITAELVSRFTLDRPALPAMALTTDTSILTAISNDYGYESLFSRQLEASGRPGDVFIAISTSGNSPNILRALATASQMELVPVGLSGATGGQMDPLCRYCIRIPSTDTARIQEAHITVGHILCAVTERALFAGD